MINLIQNKNGYYYLLYKITNKINGHFYIGVHSTMEPFDRYMGSGYALRDAKKKYGYKNFTKEILFSFENEDDMYKKEAEIVTLEFIKRKDVYNIAVGGRGSKHSKIQTELIEIDGIKHTKKEWCRIYNKDFENVLSQMYDHNISFVEALFKKRQRRRFIVIEFNGKALRINEWEKITGITRNTIRKRYIEGLDVDQIFKEYIQNGFKKCVYKFNRCIIEFNGMSLNPTKWAEITGISASTIQRRYLKGLTNDDIFKEYIENGYEKVIHEKKVLITIDGVSGSANYWSKISGVSKNTILKRKRQGYEDRFCVFGKL